MMTNDNRSRKFSQNGHNRYWWHRTPGCDYVPIIYQALSEQEWNLISDWFEESEKSYELTGEAGVPIMSFLLGLINGNSIDRIVQCGHYIGYSSLMFGFFLRMMNKKHSIYSIDIDEKVTAYSQKWIDKADLNDFVKLNVNNSAALSEPSSAELYLRGKPQLVFIDSSHQYRHTLEELDLWYPSIVKGGFLALHDTSEFARAYDNTKSGGVASAVKEWAEKNNVRALNINGFVTGGSPGDFPYLDGCGLTLIQKND